MARYIDSDILYNNIEGKYKFAKGGARNAYSDVLDTICEMPIADVQEVKHGWWKTCRFGFELSICSICSEIFEGGDTWKYCPHCGAKMDGERQ